MKKRLVMIAGVCVWTLIAAAGLYQNYSKNEKYQKQLFAMDTYMEFTAYGRGGQQAVEKAAKEVQRLDALLSAQNEESQVYALNQRGSLEVSDDLAEIIQRGKEIFQETDGLFDDTIYPLMELWGFPTGEYHVPSGEEIENLLPDVDGGTVEISGNTVTLGEGQQIDLGGIAKGYTGEKLTEIFQGYGVSSAMVSLGGNIQAIGTKEDGRTYIHIIDPRTGYPVENDLLSVTIVSPDGTLADGLSTALYIMGYDKAVQFWEQHQDEFDVILITADEQIHVSKKLQDSFQSDKNWETIE